MCVCIREWCLGGPGQIMDGCKPGSTQWSLSSVNFMRKT
jgi:hypothetical protein